MIIYGLIDIKQDLSVYYMTSINDPKHYQFGYS
jgi:hypothetical protein